MEGHLTSNIPVYPDVKFTLDFSSYLSIIIPGISTFYKISYHTDTFHHMMDMLII